MKACIVVACLVALVAGAVAADYEAPLPSIDGTANLRRLLAAHVSAAEQAAIEKLQSKAAEANLDVQKAEMDARIDTDTAVRVATKKGAEKISDANQKVYEAIQAANAAKLKAAAAHANAEIHGNDKKDENAAAKADKAVDLAAANVEKAEIKAKQAQSKARDIVQTAESKSIAKGKAEVAAAQKKSDKLSDLAKKTLVKAQSN